MAYIRRTSAYPHVVPKRLLQYWQEYVLPWRKTQDKILFKSSCIRAKEFHRLAKRTKIKKYNLHIFLFKIYHCPETEIFIILKAPSHKKGTNTQRKKQDPPAHTQRLAPQGAV